MGLVIGSVPSADWNVLRWKTLVRGANMMELENDLIKVECEACDGVGTWFKSYSRELDEYFDPIECKYCDGTGKIEVKRA